MVLYDKRRINLDDIKINTQNVKYIKINRLVLIFFALLSMIGKIEILLIPHHILGNIIRIFAKEVHYIDDGMDTLRDMPKNFDLIKIQFTIHSKSINILENGFKVERLNKLLL
ncbi:hypothetical protein N5T98_04970 [Aliarcobacter cryaerophilus]|uniref:hypothetical protein n=1 Tax=Aliarcobacter cryaerophilus TaxID=28198 RepID=UPI0021B60663|nr:hypothetical protein [Aliarcobacter cryaerophilus]MCT7486377.1 hypothetical protein [Aliarcobacter cryaerophilus]MCT7490440.1 hypothetical protein [Aliarcobacter cryaerophilus]